MIEIKNVSYKYKGLENAIENINLEINDSETIAIIRKKWFWKINSCKNYCTV